MPDCCDGSDEYDGKVKCPNTCWKAGKVSKDKLKRKIATYLDGVAIRNQEVKQAKEAMAKDEAELSKLQKEEKILRGLVQQLKGRVLFVFTCECLICLSAKLSAFLASIGCTAFFGVAYR